MLALLVALVVVPVVCGGEAEWYESLGYTVQRIGFKECRTLKGEPMLRCEESQGLQLDPDDGLFSDKKYYTFQYRCCQHDWSCNWQTEYRDCCPNSWEYCAGILMGDDYCCDSERQKCRAGWLYNTCQAIEGCEDDDRELCHNGAICCLKTEQCYQERCYPKSSCTGGTCTGAYKGFSELAWADDTCEPNYDKCY